MTYLRSCYTCFKGSCQSTHHPYSSQAAIVGIPHNSFPFNDYCATMLNIAFIGSIAPSSGAQDDAVVFSPVATTEDQLIANIVEANIDKITWCVESFGMEVGE